jgi:hypothetical protein
MNPYLMSSMGLIITFLALPSSAISETLLLDSTYVSASRFGPFALLRASGDTMKVFVDVGHVHRDSMEYKEWLESDYSYTFTDSRGKILYRVNQSWVLGSTTEIIVPAQMTVPLVGPLVLVMDESLPSAPGTGLTATPFGLDPFDNIVPYSSPLAPHDDRIDPSSFRPVLLKGSDYFTDADYSSSNWGTPAIETDYWTGSFMVSKLEPVWWKHGSHLMLSQNRYHVKIDTTDVAGRRIFYRQDNVDTVVALYSKPDTWQPTIRHLAISPRSSIRFLDARQTQRWWLHVIIDGVEGYVSDPDFEKLGLPNL